MLCSSSWAGMSTTRTAARGRRPNQSGIAAVARASAVLGLGVDLLAGREVERRVAAEAGDGVGTGAAADGPRGERLHLGVDPVDLGEARAVELVGGEVERGVDPDQAPVGVVAAGDVAQAGALRRAGGGQDLGREDVVEAGEGRADRGRDGVAEVGGEPGIGVRVGGPARRGHRQARRPPASALDGREERPGLVRGREQLGEDVDDAVHGRRAGDQPVGEAAAEAGDVRVDHAPDPAQALDHCGALGGRRRGAGSRGRRRT